MVIITPSRLSAFARTDIFFSPRAPRLRVNQQFFPIAPSRLGANQ